MSVARVIPVVNAVPQRAPKGRGHFWASRTGRGLVPMIQFVRGELIVQAYAALDAGDVAPLVALLDPQVRWIGVGGIWTETPT